jgi:hypothetical protein
MTIRVESLDPLSTKTSSNSQAGGVAAAISFKHNCNCDARSFVQMINDMNMLVSPR